MPAFDELSMSILWSVCIPKTKPTYIIEQPPDESVFARLTPTLSTPAKTDFNTTTATKATSIGGTGAGSLSWNAGDLIVVLGTTTDQTVTLNTPTGPASLDPFQSIAGPITTTSSCWVRAWATFANASGSGTISATRAGAVDVWGIIAWRIDGTTTDGIGAVNAPAASTSQVAVLPYEASNSAVVEIISDWGAGVGGVGTVPSPRNWTPSSGVTEREAVGVSGKYNVYSAEWTNQTGGLPTDYGISVAASGQNYTRLVVEILGKTDTGTNSVNAAETVTGTDTVTQLDRPLAETITINDTVPQFDRPLSETVSITDSSSITVSLTVSESIAITDTVSSLDTGATQKSDSETVTISEAITKLELAITENVTVNDNTSQLARPIAELSTVTDSASLTALQTVTETVNVTDITTTFSRTGINDNSTITDSVSGLDRPVTETVTITEATSLTVNIAVNESIGVTDTVSVLSKTANESVTITENASTGTPVSATENVILTDIVTQIERSLAETNTITDSANVTVSITVSESLSVTDNIALSTSLTNTETINIADAGSKQDIPLVTWLQLTAQTQVSGKDAKVTVTLMEG